VRMLLDLYARHKHKMVGFIATLSIDTYRNCMKYNVINDIQS